MGRPRRTDRYDDTAAADRDERDREPEKDDFENEMFADDASSPLHIPVSLWPDGRALRWISIEVTGAPDNRNWSIKSAAHWSPVVRGKYPKIDAMIPHVAMPGVGDTGASLNIIFGGLCLCERDIRYTMRDKKNQEKATQDAGRTIESYVEGGNSSIPRRDFGSSPVQYERGVRPAQFKE